MLAFAAASLVLGAGIAAASPPTPDNPAGRDGEILGIVPTQAEAAKAAGKGGGGSNLVYHGGKVLLTNRTFAIYWVPTGYSIAAGYDTTIDNYFKDVEAASGASDNVYSVETQYYDGTGAHIGYTSSFGGSIKDTNPYPTSGTCTDTVSQTTICLTDAQLRAELVSLFAANRLGPPDANTTYFLFTAKNVGSCYSSGSCAFSQYCAYHVNLDVNGTTVQYANQPYTKTVGTNCDAGKYPNGQATEADPTINVVSHEHRESINDPLGTAWYNRRGYEGSDKCAWNFGTLTGPDYNQSIGAHNYFLQQEWSNASSGCALHS